MVSRRSMRKRHMARSRRARLLDEKWSARIPKHAETWMRHPEKYDWPGIDTPKTGRLRASLRRRKPGWAEAIVLVPERRTSPREERGLLKLMTMRELERMAKKRGKSARELYFEEWGRTRAEAERRAWIKLMRRNLEYVAYPAKASKYREGEYYYSPTWRPIGRVSPRRMGFMGFKLGEEKAVLVTEKGFIRSLLRPTPSKYMGIEPKEEEKK